VTVHAVRVNQVGYPAGWPVRATVATDSPGPLRWHLLDVTGHPSVSGGTTVHGFDAAAGELVHTIVFPTAAEGEGWTLSVGAVRSEPFALGPPAARRYQTLAADAAKFLYHQRSGAPIATPYVEPRYARPAGHVDTPPNRGDGAVGCDRPDCPNRRRVLGLSIGCRGHDLRGGWYDAGDHGKYAVPTAVTAWLMQYAFERDRAAAGPELNIPESGNGIPDSLDEARWGLEFLLAAQLPAGDPQAGMVFHAVHDVRWTGLPLRPDQDREPRLARPPTTAATFGLAAVAAQAARVWEPYDPVFAARCAIAAERAWVAATTFPPSYATAAGVVGGGPYDDIDVRDERYWAAAELSALTGIDIYRYELHRTDVDLAASLRQGFDWRGTAPLGLLTLATAPGWTAAADATGARAALVTAADHHLTTIAGQGHGTPYAPADGRYDWGSNARVLAHALVLGAAADQSGRLRYSAGEQACLDYLLGRNANGASQVTGYGTDSVTQPHHRFFAQVLDPAYPPPPPGVLVGGPNSGLEDPVVARARRDEPPQRQWIDDIGSWATNEVTIGWNAALSVVVGHVSARPLPNEPLPGSANSVDVGGDHAGQQVVQRAGRHRSRVEEALGPVAMQVAEDVCALGRLHPLGHSRQPERVGELQDRLGQGPVRAIGPIRAFAAEGLVDLEDVHRQPAQVRERRVAGAEVVDRYPDAPAAERLQPLHHLVRLRLRRRDHRRLGDLHDQRLRRQSAVAQRPEHGGQEVRVA
jgi:endoglucanase